MNGDVPKDDARVAAPVIGVAANGELANDALNAGAAKPRVSLKDRIADLQVTAKASAARAGLIDRVKAVQDAAPAADDIKARIKDAAFAVRNARFNRDTLKAGRDGLASKVETLLKPRQVEPQPTTPASESPPTTTASPTPIAPQAERLADAAITPAVSAKLQDEASRPGRLATIRSRLTSRSATASHLPPSVPVRSDEPVTVATSRLKTTRIVAIEAEAERNRPLFSLGLLATALTAGGVLHILTTFAMPWLNAGSAFDRMRWQLEPNVMRVFPADPNGQTPLPFLTADMRYAMCRYDLTTSPVQVSAALLDLGWSLALYTPQGDNFYAVPGQEGRTVTSQFTLNTATDRLFLPQPGVRRSDTDAAQVTSPQREGLVVLRAPNLGPAQQVLADEALKRATCRPAVRR